MAEVSTCLELLSVCVILLCLFNLIPFLRHPKMRDTSNPDSALLSLVLSILMTASAALPSLFGITKKPQRTGSLSCMAEGVLFHSSLLESLFLLTFYMYSVWEIIKVKHDKTLRSRRVWLISAASYAFWLSAFALVPVLTKQNDRSQSFSKDLICNYTGATTTAALYFPAVPLSLLLIRSAIHVACYTLNAEKKTKNPFICFYIRFSVFATLIGFLTLVASTTLAIQRFLLAEETHALDISEETKLYLIFSSLCLVLLLIGSSPIGRGFYLSTVDISCGCHGPPNFSEDQSSLECARPEAVKDDANSDFDVLVEIPLGEDDSEHHKVQCA